MTPTTPESLIATQFQLAGDFLSHNITPATFTRGLSPFYKGERWSVRWLSNCLNVDSEWEYEPSPSNRDDEFYKRCRFLTLEAALAAYDKAEKPRAMLAPSLDRVAP